MHVFFYIHIHTVICHISLHLHTHKHVNAINTFRRGGEGGLRVGSIDNETKTDRSMHPSSLHTHTLRCTLEERVTCWHTSISSHFQNRPVCVPVNVPVDQHLNMLHAPPVHAYMYTPINTFTLPIYLEEVVCVRDWQWDGETLFTHSRTRYTSHCRSTHKRPSPPRLNSFLLYSTDIFRRGGDGSLCVGSAMRRRPIRTYVHPCSLTGATYQV